MLSLINPNLISDSVLILQWVIFLLLLFTYYLANKRDIKTHERLVISLFVVETLFNLYMLTRFFTLLNNLPVIVIIHATLGFFAYLLILYTILYMTEILPNSLRFMPQEKRIWLMRTALVVWLFFTFSGTIVYIALYL